MAQRADVCAAGYPSGSRKNVIVALERTRKFRNRLAHHDSLLAQDILLELDTMLSLVEWIDPDARIWLDGIQRVTKVYTERPVAPVDTLVVPAGARVAALSVDVGVHLSA